MREEETKRSSQVKRFFKKRWVFPAIYIASAALILTAVLWYQNSSTDNAIDSDKYDYNASPGEDFQEPAIEVNRSLENVVMPLSEKNRAQATIQKKFYDDNANAEQQEASLVVYKNQYHPNTGIDITVKDSETFDVVAALSGTVTRVEDDALLGNVIEMEHDKGIVTRYSSIKDIKVEVGDEIEQGQVLAMAGQSLFNEEAGTHVHFEIRKDGVAVNPEEYLNKPLSNLQEAEPTDNSSQAVEDKKATEEKDAAEENGSTEEKKPAGEENGSTNGTEPKDETGTGTDKNTESEDGAQDQEKSEQPQDDKTDKQTNKDA